MHWKLQRLQFYYLNFNELILNLNNNLCKQCFESWIKFFKKLLLVKSFGVLVQNIQISQTLKKWRNNINFVNAFILSKKDPYLCHSWRVCCLFSCIIKPCIFTKNICLLLVSNCNLFDNGAFLIHSSLSHMSDSRVCSYLHSGTYKLGWNLETSGTDLESCTL